MSSTGRWRGGRPRIPSEVRDLIVRMAHENFLKGALRIKSKVFLFALRRGYGAGPFTRATPWSMPCPWAIWLSLRLSREGSSYELGAFMDE